MHFHYFLQLNQAVQTNNAMSQWVDLGVVTDACMTRPDTCTNGATMTIYIKDDDCNSPGVLSSIVSDFKHTGILTRCLCNAPNPCKM